MVPLPGIPNVSKGTNDPEHAALLAVSGAAIPFTLPLPNFCFSSSFTKLRSMPYAKKDAIVEPAPGTGTSVIGTKPKNPINNASNPNGGVVVDMWSGQNNTNSLGRWDASQNVNQPFNGIIAASFPWQLGAGGGVIPDYYGAYSTPLMDVSNGGFAIPSSSVKYTLHHLVLQTK